MITREELITSKEYWMVKIQNDLFNKVEEYMKSNKINRTQLAEQLEVTKGYISQVLNGDFNGRLSKLVELALAINTVPLVDFHDKEDYLENEYNGFNKIDNTKNFTVKLMVQNLNTQNHGEDIMSSNNDNLNSGALFSDKPVLLTFEQQAELS